MNNPEDRYFEKTIWEEFPFSFDFAKRMPPGSTTIATCTVLPFDQRGDAAPSVLNGSQVTANSKIVIVNVKAGADKEEYIYRLQAVTDTGAKVEGKVRMKIVD